VLSEVKIVDMATLTQAIQVLHEKYRVPHIVITSVNFSAPDHPPSHLSVVGSSMTSDGKARLFKIVFPAIDCYFSGTGDMFAALMVVRMREAVSEVPGLGARPSWLSDDDTPTLELPLARAAERVLSSMNEVLSRTREGMPRDLKHKSGDQISHLANTKAAELRLVRHLDCLRSPKVEFKARTV
jgi:pyridoxine kinase